MSGQKPHTQRRRPVKPSTTKPGNTQRKKPAQKKSVQNSFVQTANSNPQSNSTPKIIGAIVAIVVFGLLCWAAYVLIIKPVGESLDSSFTEIGEAFDDMSDTLSGRGSASNSDTRGKEYTHNWADMDDYNNDEVVAKFYYKINSASGNTQFGTGKITGQILNNSGKDVNYASVEFGLYMGDTKYASCYDNISSLKSNSKWDFEATCLSWKSGTTAKIEDIAWY